MCSDAHSITLTVFTGTHSKARHDCPIESTNDLQGLTLKQDMTVLCKVSMIYRASYNCLKGNAKNWQKTKSCVKTLLVLQNRAHG